MARKQCIKRSSKARRVQLAYLVLYTGSASTELYHSVYRRKADAERRKWQCRRDGYESSEVMPIPHELASNPSFDSVCQRMLRQAALVVMFDRGAVVI